MQNSAHRMSPWADKAAAMSPSSDMKFQLAHVPSCDFVGQTSEPAAASAKPEACSTF